MANQDTTGVIEGVDGMDWDYSPAPERMRPDIAATYGLFIDGEFRPAEDERTFETTNPATGQRLAHVAQAGECDVDAAMKAAKKAARPWARMPGRQRGKYLFRLARRLQECARELAVLETMDGGKPIKESRDVDLPLVAAHFFYHAGWADKLNWAFNGRSVKPHGVCGQIIPWNFPLLMAAWKLAPALACGNTVVLKPAETTPLTALHLARLLQEIDLPPGVVNIVTGDGETGQAVAEHPAMSKLAFTGSTEIGRRLMRQTAARDIPLTLELGGKSPHIVFADAAIEQAVEGVVRGIWFNQGHVCCAGSRLLVEESILEPFVAALRDRMAQLRVGDPLDKNTDIGAINSREQLDRIRSLVAAGQEEGAILHDVQASPLPSKGWWFPPCFFTGVQPSHLVAREEIFGPVLAVMSFRTPEEAVRRANSTPYGLAAGIWTDKGSKIFDIAQRLEAGVVWCNTYNQFDAASPFGGVKESGFGREGGLQGLRAYAKGDDQ
jgi:aldehyde dehydrogenase (NAD+)